MQASILAMPDFFVTDTKVSSYSLLLIFQFSAVCEVHHTSFNFRFEKRNASKRRNSTHQ